MKQAHKYPKLDGGSLINVQKSIIKSEKNIV